MERYGELSCGFSRDVRGIGNRAAAI